MKKRDWEVAAEDEKVWGGWERKGKNEMGEAMMEKA